ncbi:putative leucine-rich repeat receptor-like serine/threonine-protein kinase At2g19230 isoform X2 [Prosopis cineraria]|uniref:putative leucine-rich repeat receptor-like serine/threonine-protein kinase At2g19230 isoform X2 n=1 Tax=Prosopis cineraria TaxID=364024 RepID=UPI00240EF91C|nr:putative leucine-rich repeat receptor-like serine/threonine-protein kinase At2g19230 isoform X2 [Prosopis cineraria]
MKSKVSGDGRKLITKVDRNPGFISIDCGSPIDYFDEETNIWYQTDKNFIDTGKNAMVLPSSNTDYPYFGGLLNTLRSFPNGTRNCYTLKPKQGKHHTYLIRAYFAYGNYDGNNQTPSFDLYIGVNRWDTFNWGRKDYYITETIHTPTTDTIHVCLVKTVIGVPFISALELRPLSNSIYQTPSPSQSLLISQGRFDVASTSLVWHSRYKDDIYDRLWRYMNSSYQINGSVDIGPASMNSSYKLPAEVLKSAARSFNLSYGLNFEYNSIWKNLDKSSQYYVYFHFLEIQKLPPGQKRIINIDVDGENILSQPIILEYLKPQTIVPKNATPGYVRFNISAASKSDAPPILNAFEVYKFISPLPSPTDKTDVDAIMGVKNTYKIFNLDWQGDPCVPELAWDGLNCSSSFNGYNARITSVNLSATKLTGQIATSFSQLSELESLDLSFNNLSGSVPEFLATLPKLRVLNLSGNKLTGSIPKAIMEKSYVTLQLSLADNPGLCLEDSCKRSKLVIPLVASVSALIVIFLVSLGIWILKTKKLKVVISFSTNEESFQKNRAVSYSRVLRITNNLQNLIGEGGFGKVYHGTLKNNTQVAVKLLSQSSMQGFREFRSEVELLMVVHHRHLVSLIGYCEEGGVRALIYEYMANGNLQQHLSEDNPGVLKWNERLQIALDAAHGLDYLHNGCKPPIVHRDLKTSNILLNENMQAKISDFGLSRAFANDIDTHVSTRPAGTLGYLDPEFQSSGNLNKKSDVYSFGIILLELITGQPAIRRKHGAICHILHWVTPQLEMGDIQSIIDPRLQGNYNTSSVWKLLEIAMSCTPPSAIQRPDISHIVAELKECLALEVNMERSKSKRSSISLDWSSFRVDSSGFIPQAR